MKVEEWLPVQAFPMYAVSNRGRFFSWYVGRYMSVCIRNDKRHGLCKFITFHAPNGTSRGVKNMRSVPRVILETFIGPCPHGYRPIFKDGDPLNTELSNLKWGTDSDRLTVNANARIPRVLGNSRRMRLLRAQRLYEATTPDIREW